MAQRKPIIKIKRNVNLIPSALQSGELAVDLQNNKLYIGNSTGTSVPVASQISYQKLDTVSTPSDNLVSTQKVAKEYIDFKFPAADTFVSKPVLLATGPARQLASNPTNFEVVDLSSFVINQTTGMNLQTDDVNDPANIGFFQTVKTEMFLNLTYSLHYTAIDNAGALQTESTTFGWWRSVGFRLIDVAAGPSTAKYYSMQTTPPITGFVSGSSIVDSFATRLSGNCVIKLPKYISSTNNAWRIQLVYKHRSNDNSLDMGVIGVNMGSGLTGANNPLLADGTGIKIQIVKISESST